MSTRVLRSRAAEKNPNVVERVRLDSENNLAWLERVMGERLVDVDLSKWSLLLLVGGNDPLSFRLRVSQSDVRHDLSPSAWSHVAFLRHLDDTDLAASQLREISLDPPGGFGTHGFAPPLNGLQDSRLGAYADAVRFPNIALLSAPVPTDSIKEALDELAWQRSVLDAPRLIVRWLDYGWGVGTPVSPLSEGFGIPAAAILEAAFAAKGFDLTPGLESRSSCPEAIWQAAVWWYEFYQKTAERKVAMNGAYSAKHDLIPEESVGETPPTDKGHVGPSKFTPRRGEAANRPRGGSARRKKKIRVKKRGRS